MDYILHIDTSSDKATIAAGGNGKLLAVKTSPDTRNHASFINVLIEDILNELSITLSQISAIAVCAGPGSYTGLRIGLATAKGFCYVLDKPLILDNKLTLLAQQAFYYNPVGYDLYMTLLVARDKEFFITAHDNNFNTVIAPRHIAEEQLSTLIDKDHRILVTTAVNMDKLNSLISNELRIVEDTTIELQNWVKTAFDKLTHNDTVNLFAAVPFYLKEVYTHK